MEALCAVEWLARQGVGGKALATVLSDLDAARVEMRRRSAECDALTRDGQRGTR